MLPRSIIGALCHARIDRRASVVIEYAVVLPLLLTFVLGLMDTGRLLWSYTTLYRAVEVAARCAAIDPINCGSVAAIKTYAAGQAWGQHLTATNFTVTALTCGQQVAGTMSFHFFTPWYYIAIPFGASNTLSLHATSCYPA